MAIDATVGGASANSYVTAAEALAYHAARGNSEWAALSGPVQESSLIRAADYLEIYYRGQWKGTKATTTQALSWPRTYAYVDGYLLDEDTLPTELKAAQMELALRASTSPLLPDEAQAVRRERVEQLEVWYQDGSNANTRFAYVIRLLANLLIGTIGSSTFSSAQALRV